MWGYNRIVGWQTNGEVYGMVGGANVARWGAGGTRVQAENSDAALWLVCAATVTVFSNMYITQPILPVLGREFGVAPAVAGLTVSVMVIAIACASIFYGLLSDRVGRKGVMVVGIFGLSVPTLLCAVAPDFGLLLAARIGQGLLVPSFTAVAITYLHEEMPATRRGFALGMYTAATVVGGFLGRVQSAILTDLLNWRWAFVSFGLITLVMGVALARWLPASRGFATTNDADARLSLPAQLACYLRNPRLLLTYATGFAIFFAFVGIFTYLPYYLTHPPFNLSPLVVGFVFVVYLAGTISAPLSGHLAGRLGRVRLIVIGLSLIIVGDLLTLVPMLGVVVPALVITCFGMFMTQSAVQAHVGDVIGAGAGRGSAVALYTAFFYFGGSLGGFAPGVLWQNNGWPAVVACCVGVVAAALVCVRFSQRA